MNKKWIKAAAIVACICLFLIGKWSLVNANEIIEAENYNIGDTVTNNSPEYMNYYKFNIASRKTIEINFWGYSHMSILCRLYLYDSNYNVLDCENPAGFYINGAKKVTKRYTLDKGTYYFCVNDNDTAIDQYIINLSYINTSILYNYAGDTQETAKMIKMGEKVSSFIRGTYYEKCDQYYKITLNNKSQLVLNFKWYSTNGDNLTISLYDSSLKKVDCFEIVANYEMPALYKYQKLLKKGTYYILVYYGYNTIDGNQYDMEVNQKSSIETVKAKSQMIFISSKYKKTVTQKVATLKKKKIDYKLGAKAKGTLTYKVTRGSSKYITVSKKGVVTLKKGCKKGIYQVTITAAATKDGKYKRATKDVIFKVK